VNREDILRVEIEYKDAKVKIEGQYNDVWKSVNEFFKKIKETFAPSSSIVSVKGKNVPEILISLRDNGFFNEPKSCNKVYDEIKNLGKTDITSNAVSMALKDLSSLGEFRRFKLKKIYVYLAPYIDHASYEEQVNKNEH